MDSAGFCAFARPSKPRHSCVDLRIERARRGKGNEAKTVLFIQRFAASHCFPRAIHPAAQKKKPSSVKGQGLSRIVIPPHTGYSDHSFISASRNGGKTVRTYSRYAFSLLLRSDIQCSRTCTGSHHSRLSGTFRKTYCLRQCICF